MEEPKQELIVQTVYDDILSSNCTHVASDIHCTAKTGESQFLRKISSKIITATPCIKAKTSINNDMKGKKENPNEKHECGTKTVVDYVSTSDYTTSTSSTKSKKRSWVEVNVNEENLEDQSKNGIHQNVANHQKPHLVGGNMDLKQQSSLEPNEQKIKNFAKEVDNTTLTSSMESAVSTTSKTTDVIKSEKKQSKGVRKNSCNLDIWGRVPPRDVSITCSNCGKHVGVSRFTIHLEKCMGFHFNTRKSSM